MSTGRFPPNDPHGTPYTRILEEASGLIANTGQLAEEERCAEHVGERRGLIVGQFDGVGAGVGIVHVEEGEFTLSGAM